MFSGSIDLAELTLLLKDIGQRLSADAVRSLFSSMDVSGDGQISFDEFFDAMLLILEHPSLAGRLESIAAAKSAAAAAAAASAAASSSSASASASAAAEANAIEARRGQSMANLTAILAGFGAAGPASAVSSPAPASGHESFPSKQLGAGGAMRPLNGDHAGGDGEGEGGEEEEEEEEEEEDEVPEDLASLGPEQQQTAIKIRAAWMMALGTALILLFSDPMGTCRHCARKKHEKAQPLRASATLGYGS